MIISINADCQNSISIHVKRKKKDSVFNLIKNFQRKLLTSSFMMMNTMCFTIFIQHYTKVLVKKRQETKGIQIRKEK